MRPTRRNVTTMFVGSAVMVIIAALGQAQAASAMTAAQPMPDTGFLMLITSGLMGLASITPWGRF